MQTYDAQRRAPTDQPLSHHLRLATLCFALACLTLTLGILRCPPDVPLIAGIRGMPWLSTNLLPLANRSVLFTYTFTY